MASGKNTPPKGVVVAIGLIVLMIVLYFILAAIFPDLFEAMNVGDEVPVKPEP